MAKGLRLSPQEHRARSWRIDAIAPDFELLDVWRTPMAGAADEFAHALAVVDAMRPDRSGSAAARALFRLREGLGRVFGWDRQANTLPIPGCTETSLRDRLPPDERAPLPAEDEGPFPFRPVFRNEREAFSELSNDTVHAVMHLSWVPEPGGDHRANMAVYVKHRGRLGHVYMGLIAPFRHGVVYPAMMRQLEQQWRARRSAAD